MTKVQPIVFQPRESAFGRYGKLLLVALVICIIAIVGMWSSYQEYFNPPNGPQERYHSLSATAAKKIAIFNIQGTILEGDGFVKKQIDRVRDDKDVVAVVLRIDSPGGTVTGSDYIYYHLRALAQERGLPMVVSMGGLCASGGYYIAMAVGDQQDVIFAEPTTWTGSIGVVIPHYNLAGLLESWDVKDDSISSHPYKLMGSPTRQLSEEERKKEQELLQGLVDESFERFKQIVRNGRPKLRDNDAKMGEVATGQIFSADQALSHGLVDKIGFIDDAVARAAQLAGIGADQVRCVEYIQPPGALDVLLGASAKSIVEDRSLNLSGLLDLTAPRAYYLSSWLPNLMKNNRP